MHINDISRQEVKTHVENGTAASVFLFQTKGQADDWGIISHDGTHYTFEDGALWTHENDDSLDIVDVYPVDEIEL